MFKRLRHITGNSRGLTLLELIIAMLVLSIIMTVAFSMFAPMFRAYERANNLAEVNSLMDNVAALIIDDLANATEAPDDSVTHLRFRTTYFVEFAARPANQDSDQLVISKQIRNSEPWIPVLPVMYYKGNSMIIEYIDITNTGVIIFELTLRSPDDWVRTKEYAVRPVGLE